MTVFKPPRWWEEKQRYVYDNKTHRRMDFESWDKFERFLYKLSERPLNGKQNAELVSPAIFKPDTPRRNVNVTAWAGWAAVDVDDVEINGELNAFVSQLAGSWRYVCYSTASSKRDKPKFRLIFDLDRSVPAAEIKHFWFALQSHLDERGDKQCKDLCRMYYIPAQYAEAYNFIFSGGTDPISVDELLAKYPYVDDKKAQSFLDRLPDAWKEQIIEHRKSALDDTTYKWSSYKDCPFVNKKLIDEWNAIANVDGTGRYRMIYKIMIAIAMNAVKKSYPLTAFELVELIRQLDSDTSNKYQSRALEIEANNALEYAYKYGV
jgi:hypothetical protein